MSRIDVISDHHQEQTFTEYLTGHKLSQPICDRAIDDSSKLDPEHIQLYS